MILDPYLPPNFTPNYEIVGRDTKGQRCLWYFCLVSSQLFIYLLRHSFGVYSHRRSKHLTTLTKAILGEGLRFPGHSKPRNRNYFLKPGGVRPGRGYPLGGG